MLTEQLQLFCTDDFGDFGLLQSTIHEIWVRKYSGTIGETLRYSSSDSFDTFAPPISCLSVKNIGQAYYEARQALMINLRKGPTELYNRFHDPDEAASDIKALRKLHRQLDTAVACAYGWTDLYGNEGAAMRHDFYETKQGLRWTIHAEVRRDILARLLALNHDRYVQEVGAGFHAKKGAKRKSANSQEPELKLETTKPISATTTAKPKSNDSQSGQSSSDVVQSELLNAIFTCVARREVTHRNDLLRQVVGTLGFKRLSSNLREVIASGINSAIRRGLVSYDAQNIHRIAARYAELDNEVLVNAINASVRPGCVYTPDEVFHRAAEYLGCQRIKVAFRERLESALTAASRRGILTKRGDEIRKS